MAKIIGIELKAIKRYIHEDDLCVQANIYYQNKKIGSFFDDGMGNETVDIKEDIKKDLELKVKKYYKTHIMNDFMKDWLDGYIISIIEDILNLKEKEDLYKKYSKKWSNPSVVEISPYKESDPLEKKLDKQKQTFVYNEFDKKDLEDLKKEGYLIKEYKVYSSLNDFIIE